MYRFFASCLLAFSLASCGKKEDVATRDGTKAQENQELSYNFHVRPILSDKCFFCHGPDEANNKAGLRLDQPERAYAALKESKGYGIVPGDAEHSVVVQRILSDDPELIMPPPESKRTLTAAEKDIIRRWVDQGAKYEKHWAFIPLPDEVEVPEASEWANNEIDHFIEQRLVIENLTPSPEAPAWQWLRRASYDLTGLPPTPEEIADFENKATQPGAYAAEVDRLLARPSYGQRMAVPWLDAARYADSYGYQSDQLNVSWPYRDWVVKSFNENQPYDEFLIWNMAGDLLPNATREQKLATVFNRLHRMTNEGGSVREEFRIEYAADRIHTVGTAVLGLTMECTRCHDHKYDPLTMKDYYGMMAFFNNIDENGLYDHVAKIPSPSLLLPNEKQQSAHAAAQQKVADLEKQTPSLAKSREQAFQAWLKTPEKTPVIPDLIAELALDVTAEKTFPNSAPGAKQNANRGGVPGTKDRHGRENGAVLLSGDNGISIPNFYRADRWDATTHSVWLNDSKRDKNPVVVMQRTHGTDVGYNGYDMMLENGLFSARWYRVWPGNAIGIQTVDPIPENTWVHVAWTNDGSSRASGLKIHINGKEAKTRLLRDGPMTKSVGVRTHGAGNYTLGERFRDKGFTGGKLDDFRIHSRALTAPEIAQLYDNKYLTEALANNDAEALRNYYLGAVDAVFRKHLNDLRLARHKLVTSEDPMLEVPTMVEMKNPRPTYILDRGAYDAPKDQPVQRQTPDFLPPMQKEYPNNRLGFARWTTSKNHPLTARVFVNRMWQEFFGTGLVKSSENFGVQGDLPSHPELLDWLARDFVDHGWDVKRLCKQMVLSATYRQGSTAIPELRERDPENKLLARAPAYRFPAEMIRDTALAASGLLNSQEGGPPVSPYQAGGDLWRENNGMSPAFRQSVGTALYRRSLYSVWKRTAPFPNMMVFDATSREVCTVKRARTNTPLQALVLLNDVQFVEACRVLADKELSADGKLNITEAFVTLTGRPPTVDEFAVLNELHAEQLDYFTKAPAAAKKLLTVGAQRSTKPAPQLAAATVVVQTIFNLDATIWKR
ncbi:hypothetical protein NT6N_28490 [Oceaniferula spumae]|uniref:Planctomycete cytochrome C n=1 Tax=Oceaniferula spumae TaxID=2979115 RepID=A0AAT9FP87_9BACT